MNCSHCDEPVRLCAEGVVKLSVMGPECWSSKVTEVWCDQECYDAGRDGR